jgi:hypothetical protein
MIINSQPFPGPYVRVRGRIVSGTNVEWDKALRSFRAPRLVVWVLGNEPEFFLRLLNQGGAVLEQAPVWPLRDSDVSSDLRVFSQRMRYQDKATRIALVRAGTEIGSYDIPPEEPRFNLVHPAELALIRARSVLTVKWQQPIQLTRRDPVTVYHARFSPDGGIHWYRFAVNLREYEVPVDLASMPSGGACCVQVLGTNGYHTSYVETPHFRN